MTTRSRLSDSNVFWVSGFGLFPITDIKFVGDGDAVVRSVGKPRGGSLLSDPIPVVLVGFSVG